MVAALLGISRETLRFFIISSPYLLFGFLVAGILYVCFSRDRVFRHLGGNNWVSVLKAAVFGIPLPLCSCGVIPTALSMRRQGASIGATLSFLISTPETGVDSISITYALMDPIFTIFRPLSAFITAVLTGGLANLVHERSDYQIGENNCNICGLFLEDGHKHTLGEKITKAFSYAYGEFLGDIAKWLLVGFILAGVLSYYIPDNFFQEYLGAGFFSMIVMLAVGIPLYICATSTTPIAATLLLKGLNPGAVLVFMLSGPATNIATITMVFKYLGHKAAVIYLCSIAFISILMGYALNYLYRVLDITPLASIGQVPEFFPEIVLNISAIILGLLILYALYRGYTHKLECAHDKTCSCR